MPNHKTHPRLSPYGDWRLATESDDKELPAQYDYSQRQNQQYLRALRVAGDGQYVADFLDKRFVSRDNGKLFLWERVWLSDVYLRQFQNNRFLSDDTSIILFAEHHHIVQALKTEIDGTQGYLSAHNSQLRIEVGPPIVQNILKGDVNHESDIQHFEHSHPNANFAVTAIIDDGIAFANQRFRTSDNKTRFDAIWFMDASSVGQPEAACGRILYRSEINELIETHTRNGTLVDEAALYRDIESQLSIESYLRRPKTHGTHVLDLFSGAEPTAPQFGLQRPIVAVQLPRKAVLDTSGTENELFIQLGVDWISQYVEDYERQIDAVIPLVTNFSFGLFAGPHDGSSEMEKTISRMTQRNSNGSGQNVSSPVVVPAGNSYESQTHAQWTLSQSQHIARGSFNIQQNNFLSTFIEFWTPELKLKKLDSRETSLLSRLRIRLEDPLGNKINEQSFVPAECCSEHASAQNQSKEPIFRIYHEIHPSAKDADVGKEQLLVAVLPTKREDWSKPVAAAGVWTFELTMDMTDIDESDTRVDAWIQRGGSVFGHKPHGRQTRFLEADQSAVKSYIQKEGTLNALATAKNVISVAGYQVDSNSGKDGRPASYSSAGIVKSSAGKFHPTVAAPSELNDHQGIPAAGSLGSSIVHLSGTSFAAPQVAREIATQLGANPTASTNEIIQLVLGPEYKKDADIRIGYGKFKWNPS